MEHPIVITSQRTVEETSDLQLKFKFDGDFIEISWVVTVPYPMKYIRLDTVIK